MKKIILLLITFNFILSCSQEEEDYNLTVKSSSTTTNILNNVIYPSCVALKDYWADPTSELAYDVTSEAVYYKNMTMEWDGKEPLSIIAVTMYFSNPNLSGGKFECSLGADEIEALFGDDANFTAISRQIRAKTDSETDPVKVTSLDGCMVMCGGITFKDKTKATLLSGTLEVYASYPNEDRDNLISVVGRTPISSFYKPR